jgi:hypothetical protein
MNRGRLMNLKFYAAIMAAILVGGCAKEGDGPAKAVDEFQGVWQSNCVKGQLARTLTAPVKFGVTQVTQLEIQGTKLTEISSITSGDCEGGDVEVIAEGEFERLKSAESPPVDSAAITELDLNILTYHVKPVTEFGVRVMNLRKWCGISDWIINHERDVTAFVGTQDCFSLRSLNTVYSIEDGRLFFGDRESVRPGAERSKALQKDLFFVRLDPAKKKARSVK